MPRPNQLNYYYKHKIFVALRLVLSALLSPSSLTKEHSKEPRRGLSGLISMEHSGNASSSSEANFLASLLNLLQLTLKIAFLSSFHCSRTFLYQCSILKVIGFESESRLSFLHSDELSSAAFTSLVLFGRFDRPIDVWFCVLVIQGPVSQLRCTHSGSFRCVVIQ